MHNQKFLWQLFGCLLVLLLLVGCGGPVKGPAQSPIPTYLPNPPTELPSTSRITLTPGLPSMVFAMAPVVYGRGVPYAGEYNPDQPGPHPVLILSTSGTEYSKLQLSGLPSSPWNSNLPPGWLPSSIEKIELVVLMGPEIQISLGSAPYSDGNQTISIPRYKYEQDIEIRAARTGMLLDSLKFIGSEPIEFPAVSLETILYGTRFSYSDLERWICPKVNRLACWVPVQQVETGFTNTGNIVFSPDGRILASGTADGAILLWDTTSWTSVKTIADHTNTILSIAFSPDGRTLASVSNDGVILLTDTVSGSKLGTLVSNNTRSISVAFSPDGRYLASGSNDGTVILWDIASGTTLQTIAGHSDQVGTVAFSPDGRILASGSKDGTTIVTEVTRGTKVGTLAETNGAVNSVVFSPDGRILATGYENGVITLWDVASGTMLNTLIDSYGLLFCMAFSPDGSTLASGSGMELWDVTSGNILKPSEDYRSYSSGIAFSPDGLTLVNMDDYQIQIWKLNEK